MPMRWRWPPRERVRVAVDGVGGQADQPSSSATASRASVGVSASAVDDQRLGDDSSTVMRGLRRGVRILEDELHVAAQLAQLLALDAR